MKILVSGVASDIGHSIGNLLSKSDLVDVVAGCDIHSQFYGADIFESLHLLPRASDPSYVSELRNLIQEQKIDAFIPTSEQELRFFMSNMLTKDQIGAICVAPNQFAMEIGFDKLKTSEYLKSIGCLYPSTQPIAEAVEPLNLPYVVKDPTGAGSASVFIVDKPNCLNSYKQLFPHFICQEFLEGSDEYTCGVYQTYDDSVRIISLKRRLASGVTVFAEVVDDPAITSLCEKLAHSMGLRGSINIQLKLTPRGPIIFEINPRFSSSVGMRHLLGYSDVLWSLQEQVLGIKASPYYARKEANFLYRRYIEEVVP